MDTPKSGGASPGRRNSMHYGATSSRRTSGTAAIPVRRYSHYNGSMPSSPGKINSLGHFASSYSRAQGFLAIEPPSDVRARTYFVEEEGENQRGALEEGGGGLFLPAGETAEEVRSGLLENQYHEFGARRPSFAAHFYNDNGTASPTAITAPPAVFEDDSDEVEGASLDEHAALLSRQRRLSYLPSPEAGMTVLREGEATAGPGTEGEPVIIREVEGKDGKVVTIVAGQSTAPQTVFNSVNVLVGVGLLSLSLGFKYSGWLIGTAIMTFAALATFYTARLLSKCMDTDHTLVTYADIAYAAYGPRARILTSILFTLEISGAGVTMVVLFADSLNALFPQFSTYDYKILAFFILTPLCYLPLRILSVSSVLGIMCTFGLVVIVLFDGLYKTTSPGSLLHPMETWLLPQNWMAVPLSIGIFMAPWGGHAVFPNIYRDMRHPTKYFSVLVATYQITFPIDMAMAILGFLMFGADISGEVSRNIILTDGYPASLSLALTAFIGLIPLAKTPLNVRPIVSTLDVLLGLDHIPLFFPLSHFSSLTPYAIFQRLLKIFLRIFVVFYFVLFAILCPSFDRIIGLLGCSMCTTICVLGPIAFYLKIYGQQVSRTERILCYVLFVVFTVLAVLGTVWCFLSPETIENGF